MIVMGIDLRSSQNHASAVCVLDGRSAVTLLDAAHTDDELVQVAEEFQPSLIAIGTPLGLPEGYCCLEIKCDCGPSSPDRKGRQLELELARLGISCFFTGKGSIIRNLIYRGIRLATQFRQLGFEVIEVYPHATKVILFGDSVPPKNSSDSLPYMRERLPKLVQNLEPRLDSLDSNACDSLFNCYTALLYSRNETDWLGNTKEGFLTLPKLVPAPSFAAG